MSGLALKWIAMLTMAVDHAAIVEASPAYMPMRIIGRVAFPLFVFLMAEGAVHTRSLPRYILRMALFALVSEIPFDIYAAATGGASFMQAVGSVTLLPDNWNNVFFTLTLGLVAVWAHRYILEKTGQAFWGVLLGVLLALLSGAMHTDYGMAGVLGVFVAGILPERRNRQTFVTCWFVFYYVTAYLHQFSLVGLGFLLLSLVAGALMFAYNGKKQPRFDGWPRPLAALVTNKWVYYAFYPAHLLVLAGIAFIMGGA